MVFKGVQGVTSSMGSLEALWEGNITENNNNQHYKTITISPNKTFKSSIVEDWSKMFIDLVSIYKKL